MSVDSMAILILLGSFFLMIMLRFPIAYAVALSSVFCLMSQGLPLTTICQQMVKGISSFSLMAVPFFITMGCLMGSGGISEKLIALANACVGYYSRWYFCRKLIPCRLCSRRTFSCIPDGWFLHYFCKTQLSKG